MESEYRILGTGMSAKVSQIGPVHGLLARHDLVLWWQVHATWMVSSCAFMLALM